MCLKVCVNSLAMGVTEGDEGVLSAMLWGLSHPVAEKDQKDLYLRTVRRFGITLKPI